MCNAWNHSADCTCGFGGIGHAGRRALGSARTRSKIWWDPPITPTYESYVNPNARCPECLEPVFFYQSPDGGRVFFDELGPPWPKHPCTDNQSIPKIIIDTLGQARRKDYVQRYKWQAAGWAPFEVISARNVDQHLRKITAKFRDVSTFKDKSIVLYVSQKPDDPHKLTTDSIAQVRKKDEGKFELSLISPDFMGPITLSGYTSSRMVLKIAELSKAGGDRAEKDLRLRRARYRRNRQDEEEFLSRVAMCEVRGDEIPRIPSRLKSRLGPSVASKGSVIEWARSYPEYVKIKRRVRTELRRAAKIRRGTKKAQKRLAPAKWRTKSRKR